MTREEFISNAVALVGGGYGWQTRLAELLGISDRTIRRVCSPGGIHPTGGMIRAINEAMGEASNSVRHAEWICGDGDDGREYLIHTSFPKFRCLVIAGGDDYDLGADDTGVFQNGEQWLAGWVWIDKRPDNFAYWAEQAANALEGF